MWKALPKMLNTQRKAGLEERHTQSAGTLTPGCGILRSQLHAQPEPYAEVARCEVGACAE